MQTQSHILYAYLLYVYMCVCMSVYINICVCVASHKVLSRYDKKFVYFCPSNIYFTLHFQKYFYELFADNRSLTLLFFFCGCRYYLLLVVLFEYTAYLPLRPAKPYDIDS